MKRHAEPTAPWSITPQPDDDEVAALVVALATLPVPISPPLSPPAPSRWLRAGRLAALGGLRGGPQSGWGRDPDGPPPA